MREIIPEHRSHRERGSASHEEKPDVLATFPERLLRALGGGTRVQVCHENQRPSVLPTVLRRCVEWRPA